MNKYEVNQIKGVIPAMLTFFDENEEIDEMCTRRMVDFMIDNGAEGLYLTGSTGLCFMMTLGERKKVVEIVIDQVKSRVPVVVHVGDIGTKKSIELAKHAYEQGADAISSVPPFYWNFSSENIYQYYKDISDSTPLPMIVYNIHLAGLMDKSLIMRLAKLDNVKGIKYTARTHDEMGMIKDEMGKDFMVYSGCDEMAFSGMCSGADGIIGSFYNLVPDVYKKILDKVAESDIKGGMCLQKAADEIIMAALKYDFPAVLHNMIEWRGEKGGYPRKPYTKYKESDLAELKKDILKIQNKYQQEDLNIFKFD